MTPTAESAAPPAPAASRPARALRALAAPVRFARRRPARALLAAAVGLLLLTAAVGLGAWAWFERHLAAARREVAAGHNAAAVPHLEACRGLYPDHPEVLVLAARVARRSGAFDEAEVLLARHPRGDADDAVVLERLLVRAARGDVEAVGPPLLARVRAGGPDAALAREGLVTGLLHRFRWAAADRVLRDWLAETPDDPAALVFKAKFEEQRQLLEPATQTFRRVVELDPAHDDARLRLATLLVGNRRGEEALVHLGELRRRLPNHPEVAVLWAKALALQGRAAEGRAALEACLAAHPDFPPALAERGAAALLDGDEAAAARDLGRAAELDPGNTAVRAQYALVLARLGKTAEAAEQQARVAQLQADAERITTLVIGPLQTRPDDPAVPHEIAQIALRAGQVREALRWFEAALAADPDHLPTHRALAGVYHAIENPALAARHRAIAQRLSAQPRP